MPTTSAETILRLGTRGSLLARMQSQLMAEELRRAVPGLGIEMIVIKTTGDLILDQPLRDAGGKGLFIKELEQGLLDETIDLAVHSYKDVPVTMPLVAEAGLTIAATPPREDPRDVLICRQCQSIGALPAGAKVGSGSLRRRCQLLALRPDLEIVPVRGNIDTRIGKLRAGELDAVILAMAGLRRAGLFDPAFMTPIDLGQILPAPGQGALALQCRAADERARKIISRLNDANTAACVAAERAVVAALEGDCHSPIGTLAEMAAGKIRLRAVVGHRDGRPPVIAAQAQASSLDYAEVVGLVCRDLMAKNAVSLLRGR